MYVIKYLMACSGPPLSSSLLPEYGCEYEICEDLSNVQDGKICKTCKACKICKTCNL